MRTTSPTGHEQRNTRTLDKFSVPTADPTVDCAADPPARSARGPAPPSRPPTVRTTSPTGHEQRNTRTLDKFSVPAADCAADVARGARPPVSSDPSDRRAMRE
ncbi:hypothetical protein GCM10011512_14780 [Tersicoccus solisilvae]|uniref:Uncharacterized protein n=1 Tax=Tersicoccus solisilvae TaxID=1882339 RepID=A0ABQ1P0P3_9MICC|nr:hypothetical protein GCM10011512_14780 [Tersicoccus solisilvae]